MREIKFRGKRADNGEWVYGDLIHFPATTAIGHPDKDGVCWEEYYVIPETVGQSIGLKDSKRTEEYPEGQEIYGCIPLENGEMSEGGDIIKYEWEDILWVIEWHDLAWQKTQACTWQKRYPNRYELNELTSGIEVIGNVHQNKELLK